MDPKAKTRIRDIKAAVRDMLRERQRLNGDVHGRGQPSSYWAHFCSRFSYMLELPEEEFEQLRIHTYHLTSDTYLTYFFGTGVREFRRQRAVALAGIPRRYWIYEPEGGIGFPFEGGLVSQDLMSFQHVVNSLYRQGILQVLNRPTDRRRFALEIGSGYGGLAYHFTKLCDLTYVMVDLPETLLFSASYLAIHQPNRKTYMYSPSTFADFMKEDISTYDFVFIPNYRLEALAKLSFALVLNIESLQEMREDQVSAYLDFISRTCTGTFLSLNRDVQRMNHELTSLSEMLKKRFMAKEVRGPEQDTFPTRVLRALTERESGSSLPEHLRGLAGRILRSAGWRIDPPGDGPGPRREFICTRKPVEANASQRASVASHKEA
jgi:hypothetical protein